MNGSRKKQETEIKPIWGASQAANARCSRSKSSSDLRKSEGSNSRHDVPTFLRKKPKPLLPHEESVYNWKFVDRNSFPSNFVEQQRHEHPGKFAKFQNAKDLHVHRVEYLPCDGICADETVVVNGQNGDSGRSSSSSRTSRGINTEETRIFPMENLRQAQSSQSFERLEDDIDSYYDKSNPSPSVTHVPKTRHLETQTQTMYEAQTQDPTDNQFRRRVERGQGDADRGIREVQRSFSDLKINGAGNPNSKKLSNLTLSQAAPGGDIGRHNVGVVPK